MCRVSPCDSVWQAVPWWAVIAFRHGFIVPTYAELHNNLLRRTPSPRTRAGNVNALTHALSQPSPPAPDAPTTHNHVNRAARQPRVIQDERVNRKRNALINVRRCNIKHTSPLSDMRASALTKSSLTVVSWNVCSRLGMDAVVSTWMTPLTVWG